MSNSRDFLAYLAVFAAGATAGGLTALLFAPASGEQTRRRMAQRYDDEKSELMRKGQRVVKETAQRLEEGIEEGKSKLVAALRT